MKHVVLCLLTLTACSEEVGSTADTEAGSSTSTGAGGQGGTDLTDVGTPLVIDVPATGVVRVDLDAPAVVTDDDATDWELAFGGYDVFTNSGVSGEGTGGAFGPLGPTTFLLDEAPEVPFLLEDRTGGAFLRWYAYEGTIHALWSRFHVYGIRRDDQLFKLQILNYYGEVQGAPVSAIYQLRWAAVGASGIEDTQTITDLDGTAGGLAGTDDDPSTCLDLSTKTRLTLTVAQAQLSSAWHVCFRRDAISVNGELGGPGGVSAIDLSRHQSPDELPLETVKDKTPASELAAFDDVDFATLADPALVYRGDRIVSAFDTAWYQTGTPPTPSDAVWLVQSSDGERTFLIFVERFEGADDDTPRTLHLRVKPVTR